MLKKVIINSLIEILLISLGFIAILMALKYLGLVATIITLVVPYIFACNYWHLKKEKELERGEK